ncbi:MAG TPA: single-stranded DNA-binding protein [Planctomycetota bacterium]|jgi:single-strand DNA-binding protein
MANLNKVLLMGNLTRDVEMRFTPSGLAIAQIGLAINRKFKDSKTNEMREEVTFVDIEAFGKTAELAGKYLSKGRPVFIEGRLKLDQWEDKQTGQKRSKMKVVVDQLQFMGPAPSGQGGARPAQPQQARPAAAAPQASSAEEPPPEDLAMPEENVPF